MTTHLWVGDTSADPTNSANWSTGSVPATDDIIIFDDTAKGNCAGTLTANIARIVATLDFSYKLGTDASTPLSVSVDTLDLRSPGVNTITLSSSSNTDVSVYGTGTHTFKASAIVNLNLLGSLNNTDNPAFTGTVTVDATSDISGVVEVTGNCAGTLVIEAKAASNVPTINLDGRGMTTTLQRQSASISLEGGPSGLPNTLNIDPTDSLGITYASLNIQAATAADAIVNITGGSTITALDMDSGTIDCSDNTSSAGVTISAADLYGKAIVDLRNTLQNVTLSNAKIHSQDVQVKVDNGATMNISY